MYCPSCGAPVEADQRFAHLVVCPYCHSSFVLDEKAARIAGTMSLLPKTGSPLFVGATGTLMKRKFSILGRVRYGWERGFWDEWFVGFEDGSMAWISEDESNFTLETWSDMDKPPAEFDEVMPGDSVTIGGMNFHIDEKNCAICEGGEGQLPFEIEKGEVIPFLDLSADQGFGTIEYEPDGNTRVFVGRRLEMSEIELEHSAESMGIPGETMDREGGSGSRERVVKKGGREKNIQCEACGAALPIPEGDQKSIKCSSCGSQSDLSLRRVDCPTCGGNIALHGGREAMSVVCPYCSNQIDISKPEPSLLGNILDRKKPRAGPLKLGLTCKLRGVDYRIVGTIRFHEKDGWQHFYADEYLLHSKQAGYRWLIMENGHFSLSKELDKRPQGINPRVASERHPFNFEGQKYQVFESNNTEIVFVDGELPWVAQVGDRNFYMDAICPPYMLSAEWTEEEMEWYQAEYLQISEVATAFGIDEKKFLGKVGIAPHQPSGVTTFRKHALWLILAFAVIQTMLGCVGYFRKGTAVATMSIQPEQYSEEFLTEEFNITTKDTVCYATFEAPVDNSWVYMDLALINEKDEALLDFSAQMSYYHGYQGGESWSEGSRSDSATFMVNKPGKYRFLLLGQAGTGESPDATMRAARSVQLIIYEGAGIGRYHIILAVIAFLLVGLEWYRRYRFERTRWGEDEED